ncbi:helix-turn-helix domain-containing protein [Enterococcus hirae]|uniref:helix-turn-helix domain-containing protein n=1 Tax=Enterococcus hirae TaxID=1354 RepID=UPI00370E7F64
MREILDGRLRRQLNILEILWNTEWITTAELAEKIDSSEKTIRNDLSQVNEMIEPLSIETSFRAGIILKKDITTPKSFIYSKILEKSLEYTLLETIFLGKVTSKEELSDLLYISETQVSRVINRINQEIRFFDFQITNQIKIIGNEGNIRDFFSVYFSEKYHLPEKLIQKEERNLISEIIDIFIKENTIWAIVNNDHHLFLGNLKFQLYVCFTRLKQGYQLEVNEIPFHFTHLMNEKKLVEKIHNVFGIKSVKENLQQLFYEFHQPINPIARFHSEGVEIDSVSIKKQIGYVITLLEERFGLLCENRDKLIHDIYWTTMSSVRPTYILYNKKTDFFENTLKVSPELVTALRDEFFDIYFSLGNPFLSYLDEMIQQSIFKLLTSWSELWVRVRESKASINVALLLDSSYDHMRMLKEEIQFYFRHNIKIEILDPTTQIQKCYLQKFDCLLTDVYSPDHFGIPTIGMSSYFDEDIINKLVDYYHIKVNTSMDS